MDVEKAYAAQPVAYTPQEFAAEQRCNMPACQDGAQVNCGKFQSIVRRLQKRPPQAIRKKLKHQGKHHA